LDCRIRSRAAAKSKLLAGAGLLRSGVVLLWALGRWRPRRAPRAATEPARSIFSDLLRHLRLLPVRWTHLRGGDAFGTRVYPTTQRFRRRPQGAHRRR